jgi:plastocyanin
MQRSFRIAAVAIALAALPAGAMAETVAVTIKNMKFSPAQVSVHVGDTIVWTNQDFVAHTATARNKDWDVNLPAGKTGSITLTKAGDVDYFCRFHPNMTGKVGAAQ